MVQPGISGYTAGTAATDPDEDRMRRAAGSA